MVVVVLLLGLVRITRIRLRYRDTLCEQFTICAYLVGLTINSGFQVLFFAPSQINLVIKCTSACNVTQISEQIYARDLTHLEDGTDERRSDCHQFTLK